MAKRKLGSICTNKQTGYQYAVYTWIDPTTGKRGRRLRRLQTKNKSEFYQHIDDMAAEVLREAEEAAAATPAQRLEVNAKHLTIKQLGDYHKENHLQEAWFDPNGIKRGGVMSKAAHYEVDALVNYFGADKLVSSLTRDDLAVFKSRRLAQPVVLKLKKRDRDGRLVRDRRDRIVWTTRETPRSISSVHKELSRMRRLLGIAVEHHWITRNPWHKGLINPAEEAKREMIATQVEESALIEHCAPHLRNYLIVMFDSGCRSVELRRMKVADVDFETNSFRIYSYKGKRRLERDWSMTPRQRDAMVEACTDKNPDDYVFTWGKDKKRFAGAPKRSFRTAKRVASALGENVDLRNFRQHDARHTAMTRLLEGGLPLPIAGKLLGHTQPTTTWRYNNPDDRHRELAASILANHREAKIVSFSEKAKNRKSKAA